VTIPFYTLNIHQPLQQMLDDADMNGEWQAIIDYCEPLIETTEDDGVLLCYSFALMEQALAIHVNDVEKTGNYCLELLKKLRHTYGGTDHLKVMIRRQLRAAKNLKKKEKDLLKIPYEKLTTSEKSKFAYNLQGKSGIENNKRAAGIHLELMEIKKTTSDSYYHFGNYIICLYRSNQRELANEKFKELAIFMASNPRHGYAFLIGNCFQEKILQYKNDAVQFQQIWDEAINHPSVKNENAFPVSEDVQDELLIVADKFGLADIKKYLIDIIIAERKPRMIAEEIKKIIGV
jgi:hypothetical protein